MGGEGSHQLSGIYDRNVIRRSGAVLRHHAAVVKQALQVPLGAVLVTNPIAAGTIDVEASIAIIVGALVGTSIEQVVRQGLTVAGSRILVEVGGNVGSSIVRIGDAGSQAHPVPQRAYQCAAPVAAAEIVDHVSIRNVDRKRLDLLGTCTIEAAQGIEDFQRRAPGDDIARADDG